MKVMQAFKTSLEDTIQHRHARAFKFLEKYLFFKLINGTESFEIKEDSLSEYECVEMRILKLARI